MLFANIANRCQRIVRSAARDALDGGECWLSVQVNEARLFGRGRRDVILIGWSWVSIGWFVILCIVGRW